jgi:hypothetical protein
MAVEGENEQPGRAEQRFRPKLYTDFESAEFNVA